MMKTFASDQHELGFYSPADKAIEFTRRAARGVLSDKAGRIAVMLFKVTGSYKLPGGGIDEGESTMMALARELREETGYSVKDIQELCVYDEQRYYAGVRQISYCFTAETDEFVGTDPTPGEIREGMELVWASSHDEAMALIESSSQVKENGDEIGLQMMILRDAAIVRCAKDRNLSAT